MNYDRPELLDRLAADHAIGVLRYRARARFERLCATLVPARHARQRWEDRLLPMSLALDALTPARTVWPAIERRIDELEGKTGHGARRWWLVAVASLAAVALFVGREMLWTPVAWQPLATLAPAAAAPLWRVERDAGATQLNVRVLRVAALAPEKSYELWVLPRGAGNPVSLGLLPREGSVHRVLTTAQQRFLLAGAQVAVSIEPSAGSPTGLPTGPVIIVAPIARST